MRVEVTIPEDYMGDVMGDITSRRGRIEGMEARGKQLIRAMVPLSEMFGYATTLRSNNTRPWYILNDTSITMKKFQNLFLKKLSKK